MLNAQNSVEDLQLAAFIRKRATTPPPKTVDDTVDPDTFSACTRGVARGAASLIRSWKAKERIVVERREFVTQVVQLLDHSVVRRHEHACREFSSVCADLLDYLDLHSAQEKQSRHKVDRMARKIAKALGFFSRSALHAGKRSEDMSYSTSSGSSNSDSSRVLVEKRKALRSRVHPMPLMVPPRPRAAGAIPASSGASATKRTSFALAPEDDGSTKATVNNSIGARMERLSKRPMSPNSSKRVQSLAGVLGAERAVFKKDALAVVKVDAATFDPFWLPRVMPEIPVKRLPAMLRRFLALLTLWHVFHIMMAAAFLYFAVDWVTTTFNNGAVPSGCGQNGTLVALNTIYDPTVLATCKQYQIYVNLEAANWERGVVLYAVFNGVLAPISLLACFIVWRRVTSLEPKDARAVLKSLFAGFPKGTFMVSYAWRDESDIGRPVGELPRRIASYLPAVWLDVENLIPGTPVKETCQLAAKDALFRFAFISPNYLQSPNCLVEWAHIKEEPGRSFLFCYDSVPQETIQELKQQGHLVVEMVGGIREELMQPDWFLNQLVRSKICNPLFEYHSPAINENWRPTLRFWFGEKDFVYMTHSIPLIVGAVFIIFIDFFVAYNYGFYQLFTGYQGTAFLFALAMTLPVVLGMIGVFVFQFLKGTGFRLRHLPDVACLIIFLNRLGVIGALKIYSNSTDVTLAPHFQMLLRTGVVTVVESMEDGDIKCLQLDDIPENFMRTEDIDDSYVFWSKGSFPTLSEYARTAFGTQIIAQGVPSLEFLCCKMLMRQFNVGAGDLTVGSGSFHDLFKAQEAVAPTQRGRCFRRRVQP